MKHCPAATVSSLPKSVKASSLKLTIVTSAPWLLVPCKTAHTSHHVAKPPWRRPCRPLRPCRPGQSHHGNALWHGQCRPTWRPSTTLPRGRARSVGLVDRVLRDVVGDGEGEVADGEASRPRRVTPRRRRRVPDAARRRARARSGRRVAAPEYEGGAGVEGAPDDVGPDRDAGPAAVRRLLEAARLDVTTRGRGPKLTAGVRDEADEAGAEGEGLVAQADAAVAVRFRRSAARGRRLSKNAGSRWPTLAIFRRQARAAARRRRRRRRPRPAPPGRSDAPQARPQDVAPHAARRRSPKTAVRGDDGSRRRGTGG